MRRSLRLFLVCVAAIGVLSFVPGTHWIVRQQFTAVSAMLIPRVLLLVYGNPDARRIAAAQRHPNDGDVQIALAGADVPALEALAPRFGNQPALQAAILRALSKDQMRLKGRAADEAQILLAPETKPAASEAVTPEAARLWEQAATTGERLDPNNVFFPLAHAVGLFAARHDDEACAEIIRASGLPHYDEYLSGVSTANWQLMDEANGGESGSLPKMTVQANVLFPHYVLLRSIARLATVHAMHLEIAGQREQGFVIRRALERSGARMRSDGSLLVGNLVGQAICEISAARPGGAPTIVRQSGETADQRRVVVIAQYVQYLQSIGHPEEVAWMQHDEVTRRALKSIVEQGLNVGPISVFNLGLLTVLWIAGATLIGNAALVLSLGIVGALLCRTATVRDSVAPKPLAIVAGVVAIAVVVAYILAASSQTLRTFGTAEDFAFAPGSVSPENISSQASPGSLGATMLLLDVPVVMAFIFSVRSRKRGVPVSTGIVQGYASSSMRVAAILLLLYLPIVLLTATQEARILNLLRQTIAHEGQMFARLTGHPWPTFGP